MAALRTPDDRFEHLPEFGFAPNYISDLPGYEGLRVHYLDEGPRDASQVFLCLHGQPAWSYLYRKMIPVFTAAGHRVIAPDLLGFGRSDKPVEEETYTFTFHREMLLALITRLGIGRFTLVCQDWGGILGLTFADAIPDQLAGLLVMNTALPVGETLGEGFAAWQAFSNSKHDMDIAALFQRADARISPAQAEAYAAPYPNAHYKAGVRRFPQLAMTRPDMEGVDIVRRSADWWRNQWDGPSFMAVGMKDPVFGPDHMERLRQGIRGCQSFFQVKEGGHFVQEYGDIIARAALSGPLG